LLTKPITDAYGDLTHGAPANVAVGVRLLRTAGEVVAKDDPLFEIHASSHTQLDEERTYAEEHRQIVRFGF